MKFLELRQIFWWWQRNSWILQLLSLVSYILKFLILTHFNLHACTLNLSSQQLNHWNIFIKFKNYNMNEFSFFFLFFFFWSLLFETIENRKIFFGLFCCQSSKSAGYYIQHQTVECAPVKTLQNETIQMRILIKVYLSQQNISNKFYFPLEIF